MIKAIVCVDLNWGIGYKGDLLYHIPNDMKHFREHTIGKTVCMGYNTLLSFPGSKPLKDRKNVVLCPPEVEGEGFIALHSVEELLDFLKNEKEAWIIGGGMFYKTMLPYCNEVYVTKVIAQKKADTYFPNLDEKPEWEFESETKNELLYDEKTKEFYEFFVYRHINI